jgi:regulator of sirC expression with transglutaminase-like and TPR domain
MSVPAPSPRSRFAALVAGPESELDLARAALLVAAEEYPQLTPEPYLRRLDLIAERVKDRLADEVAAPVMLQEISRVLFQEEGFRGNADAYYDPRNSFLNDVLDRKLGIPLTLSIVFLEVGWRLGLPLRGVKFPGHFLVRYEGEALRLLVDPFHKGEIRFEDEAQELLDRVYGGDVQLKPDYLRGARKKEILVRLLSNLKGIYLNQNPRDDARALAAIERIILIQPMAIEEVRDRGMLLARTGRKDEAIHDLERYLDNAPSAVDAERVKMLIAQLGKE